MADESQVSSNAYGFLFLGLLLIICNLPVLIVVVRVRKLRSQYGVLILSLVNGLITGTVSTGYGIFRLVLFQMEKDDEVVPIGACFYNPLTFFLLWTFPMNGLGLLINSIDRLIVITFPMSYFNYNTRVVVILNVLAIIINAVLVFVAIYVTLANSPDGKMVNIFCSQNDLFSKGMYIFLAGLRIIFAVLAVSVMFIVLIIFIKHNNVRSKQAFHTEESMKKFRSKQMNYTKTMLISCIATTLFMIIPSVVAIIGRSGTLDVTGHVTTWTRFINFFNSFNIAVLLIYRQDDIRWRLYKLINKVAHRHIFNVTAIVSTSGEMTQVPVQAISKISSRRTS
ncbi:hypothetical protein L596_023055 [Steinernema carpocapsae]|uniref:G-protein coupled receptors family 1 profile domain-containing protein n=1 Tax=Steinernema carpocapsae TaxID=34508 RepID=A0A4U5MCG5_STECR|nr:hypothetical protein L596_023055 [Steinernema carpocapsae]